MPSNSWPNVPLAARPATTTVWLEGTGDGCLGIDEGSENGSDDGSDAGGDWRGSDLGRIRQKVAATK